MADEKSRDVELTEDELNRMVGGLQTRKTTQTPREPTTRIEMGSNKPGEAPDSSPPELGSFE